MSRYIMVIDTRRCVGCMDCVVACKTEMQYEIFINTHPKAKVTGKTKGKSDAASTETGLSVGGHKVMSIGTHQGVDARVEADLVGDGPPLGFTPAHHRPLRT